MRIRTIVAAVACGALATAALTLTAPARAQEGAGAAGQVWKADTVHSNAIFRVRHAGVTNFYGAFHDVRGEFVLDTDNPGSSRFEFTIGLESVDTGSENRDNHLRSPDFFNVRQFPEATFVSTDVTKTGENTYEVAGNLTLHGETKPVTVMVEHTGDGSFRGTPVRSFEATFEIKRADFGMATYIASDGSDSGPLGNTVKIIVGVEGNPAE